MKFTIDRVSWHTKVRGNTETREQIINRFYRMAKFLNDNKLVNSPKKISMDDISEDFAINSEDLTDEGMALMKAAYDKWLRKVDRSMDPSDLSIMERALKRLREGA